MFNFNTLRRATLPLCMVTMLVGLGEDASLTGQFPSSPQAATSAPRDLTAAIVGNWRGETLYADPIRNFSRASLEMTFTGYGSVLVRRGEYRLLNTVQPARAWKGDYIVVGDDSVIISPHQVEDPNVITGGVLMVGVTIKDGSLESVSPRGGFWDVGQAVRLRKQ